MYDGHSGAMTSEYLEHHLHAHIFTNNVRKEFKDKEVTDEMMQEYIIRGFEAAEKGITELLREHNDWRYACFFFFSLI